MPSDFGGYTVNQFLVDIDLSCFQGLAMTTEALGELRQEDHKLGTSLGYTANSRDALASQ